MIRRGATRLAPLLAETRQPAFLLTRRTFLAAFETETPFRRPEDDIPDNPRPRTNTFVNMCHQGTTTVVERFGKYSHKVDPGLFIAIPLIDSLHTIDLRETVINISPQGAITKDNVRIELCGSLYVKFEDSYKALYGAKRPLFAAVQQAQSVMRSCVGKMEMDDIFHNRTDLNEAVRVGIQNASEFWGLNVNRYEVTDITPDPEIAKAMDLHAAAERHRREKVKSAQAEKESTILISEGKRLQMINEAEGEAQRIIRAAEAKAVAIGRIAEALDRDEGAKRAMEFDISEKYFRYLQQLGQSPSTVFLPSDVSNVNQVVATGIASFRALSKSFSPTAVSDDISAERTSVSKKVE